jgi:hypothetical protein
MATSGPITYLLMEDQFPPLLRHARVNDRQAGVLFPGSAQFRASIADAPAERRALLEHLADWADRLEHDGLVKLSSYLGKGMVTLLPRLASDNAGLVTICNDHQSAYPQFWRGVFERRAPLSIPSVEAAAGTEPRQGNWTPNVSDELLDAVAHAYTEAAGKSASP